MQVSGTLWLTTIATIIHTVAIHAFGDLRLTTIPKAHMYIRQTNNYLKEWVFWKEIEIFPKCIKKVPALSAENFEMNPLTWEESQRVFLSIDCLRYGGVQVWTRLQCVMWAIAGNGYCSLTIQGCVSHAVFSLLKEEAGNCGRRMCVPPTGNFPSWSIQTKTFKFQ